MPVGRVLAHADIGDHDEIGKLALESADALLDGAILVPRAGALVVLHVRNAEEDHSTDARIRRRFCIAQHLIDRRLGDAGHRRDRHADIRAACRDTTPTTGAGNSACATAGNTSFEEASGMG